MLRRSSSTLVTLIVVVFSASCSSRSVSPAPTMAVDPIATDRGSGVGASDVTSEANPSGGYMPPGTSEEVADWWGVIKGTEPGAQFDDYFERQDLGQVIYFGIDSMDPVLELRIEALRDSGRMVHLYGTLLSNVPDVNASQIQVDCIEVEE